MARSITVCDVEWVDGRCMGRSIQMSKYLVDSSAR